MTISATIKALVRGELVAGSRIGVKLLNELLAEGLLQVVAQGSRKSYRASDTQQLLRYLIDQDERYRLLETASTESRSELAAETGNSKLLTIRSSPGFPVNTYEPVSCLLNGREYTICPPEGSFVFITDWKTFVVPDDIVVVGIENMENFRLIRQQRQWLESQLGPHSYLFVSRYPQSTDLRLWLMSIPNKYIHFGDFDLAGIHIYLKEFQQYLGDRSSFLIPEDIEKRLKKGSAERYNVQYERFHKLHSDQSEIQHLIDLIHQYHRCYDQEGYIINIG